MLTKMFGLLSLGGISVLSGVASAAEPPAVETTVLLRAGTTHSDNLRRTPSNEQSGTILSAGLTLDVEHDGNRADYTAKSDLDWRHYSDSAYDSDLFGHFDGLANFDLVPETFRWNFRETYGQQSTSLTAAPTPDTLENINYFTTGPTLNFRLGGNLRLMLDGSYSDTHYERSLQDSNRYNAGIGLVRMLSASNEISLNGTHEEVQFDNTTLNRDFETRQYFLSYVGRSTRGSLNADLGYTTVDDDVQSSSGVLARLNLVHRVSAAATFGAYVSRQFSNNGDIFRDRLNRSGTGGVDSSPTLSLAISDPFEDRTVGVSWDFGRGRTSFGLAVERSEELYERTVTADRTVDRLEAHVSRRVTPKVTLRLSGRHEREDLENVNFDARNSEAAFNIDWDVGRRAGLSLQYHWYDRNSSDPATEFSENQIGLAVFYRPLGR